MISAPTLRFIDCYMMDTTFAKLAVFTVHCDNVHILVQTGSSSARLGSGMGRLRLLKLDSEGTKFLTLPAYIIDYAYSDEAAHFTMQSSEVVVHVNIWC